MIRSSSMQPSRRSIRQRAPVLVLLAVLLLAGIPSVDAGALWRTVPPVELEIFDRQRNAGRASVDDDHVPWTVALARGADAEGLPETVAGHDRTSLPLREPGTTRPRSWH